MNDMQYNRPGFLAINNLQPCRFTDHKSCLLWLHTDAQVVVAKSGLKVASYPGRYEARLEASLNVSITFLIYILWKFKGCPYDLCETSSTESGNKASQNCWVLPFA